MIELEKVVLKNIVLHKDTKFEVEPGVTVIRGDNYAGKSTLVSCIPNVFDGCPPLLKKKDAKALHSENSMIGIKYKYNNIPYKVVQACKKGSISYKIEENGKELEPRTIGIAKELLEKIFPISSLQYYSVVHLTPYRANVLLSGTGPQRKEFFEELFHLDISEVVAEQIKQEYNKLKREKDEKDILLEQLSGLQYIDNIEELEKEFDDKTEQLKYYKEQYTKCTNDLQSLTALKAYQSQIKTPYSIEDLVDRINKIQVKLEVLEDQLRELKVSISLYHKNKQKMGEKKQLELELETYDNIKETSDQVKERYDALKNEGEKLKEQIKLIEEVNKKYYRMQDLEHQIDPKLAKLTLEEYTRRYTIAEAKTKENRNLIGRLQSLVGQAVCPTCNQPLQDKELQELIANCQQQIDKYANYLDKVDLTKEYLGLKELGLVFEDPTGKIAEIDGLKLKMKELKELYEVAKVKENLKLRLAAYPEDIQLQEPDESLVQALEGKIKQGQERLVLYKEELRVKQEIKKLDDLNADLIDEHGLRLEMEKLSPKIETLNEQRMELNSKIKLGLSQNESYKTKQDRIAVINKDLEDLPIYEALTKAYGAKGIRVDQIKYLADMYCNNLNKYADLVFNKDIKFTVKVDSSNFNIYAERNGGMVSDVCMLSGAESRCFALLSAISLLPFIPEKYRTDFIIFDEMEAGIKEVNRNLLAQNFFKALLSIVPKIIIITPMDRKEYYIEADREYYIRVKDNCSVMEEVKVNV